MRFMSLVSLLIFGALWSQSAWAEDVVEGTRALSIGMFIFFILVTFGITGWAARRTQSASDFYTAGGGITGLQNGLAISGDYLSAASFLGIAGMVYVTGYYGMIYAIGFLFGWPVVMFLVAEKLRNLGRYNFADVIAFRLNKRKMRVMASISSLFVIALYIIAQMVGAGKLIEMLFGLDYQLSVVVVGALMMVYVGFGGMTATTWVQITKAVLILIGATIMVFLVMLMFDFSLDALVAEAVDVHPDGQSILVSADKVSEHPIDALSLAIALAFGTAGLPHILMRFFTVPNAAEARKSVVWASVFIGYFYLLVFIIGIGAIALLSRHPEYFSAASGESFDLINDVIGGENMVAVHLADAVGGSVLLGFMAAVAFATIVAVVAGLALAGAHAVSYELYTNVLARKAVPQARQLKISRISTVVIGLLAILLGIVFEKQNVAFMVGLAFAVAASANLPVMLLSVGWRRCTTRGAMVGGYTGLIVATAWVVLSETVWVDVFGMAEPVTPFPNPAIISMPLALLAIWWFSTTDDSAEARRERDAFEALEVRSHTGLGGGPDEVSE